MARGLDKETGGSSPPKRNPFRQEIKSREELEKEREAARLSGRDRETLQKRKEEILSSPLADLYYVENFSQAAALLALAEPDENLWEYISGTVYGTGPFAEIAKNTEIPKEADAWLQKNIDPAWQTLSKELTSWAAGINSSEETEAEEQTLGFATYLLRFLFTLETKKSSRPVDDYWKGYARVQTELSHFALAAKSLEMLRDENAPWTLEGEMRAKVEKLFLNHLFSWIGK